MLGMKIKKFLNQNGIRLSFVAEKIGVSANVFSGMLNGKRKITAEEYFLICRTLEVDLEYFINQEEGEPV